MTIWPATVITPSVVYRAARADVDGKTVVVSNRQGIELVRLAFVERVTDPTGERRWWFVAGDGITWCVEQARGCGCGGTSTTAPTDADLAALHVP